MSFEAGALRRVAVAIKEGRFLVAVKRRIRPRLVRLMSWVARRPALSRPARALLNCFPALRERLSRMASPPQKVPSPSSNVDLDQFSPKVRQLFLLLSEANDPRRS